MIILAKNASELSDSSKFRTLGNGIQSGDLYMDFQVFSFILSKQRNEMQFESVITAENLFEWFLA